MKTLLVVLVTIIAPSTAIADDGERLCGSWGIDVWGLSYHIDHAMKYNDVNWGLGARCYTRPPWLAPGQASEHKTFMQLDAMLNSHRGLVLPFSAGAEYKFAEMSGCNVYFLGAVAVAYYQTPDKQRVHRVRAGPIPGLTLGCGRFRPNVIFVPNPSRQIMAALVTSLTVTF